jgi:hypothetical protein
MWKHFFDGFSLIHGILLLLAAIASFKFWIRIRFRLPMYIHVIAAIAFAFTYLIYSAMPPDAPANKFSSIHRFLIALILPAIAYFFFVVYGGPRAAYYSRFNSVALCPFCQSPVRTLPEDISSPTASPHYAEPTCAECGRELPLS